MQVARHDAALRDRNATVLVVSFGRDPDAIEAYRRRLALPFPIASDPARRAYAAFGLERGPWWRIWHPRTVWRYFQLVTAGHRLRSPARGEDLAQLGGDFVIGPDRVVRFAHASRRPDDRPAVARLLAALPEPST